MNSTRRLPLWRARDCYRLAGLSTDGWYGYVHSTHISVQSMHMAFLSSAERGFLRAASNLAFCNPFLPERILHERAAPGAEFVCEEPVWSFSVDEPERRRSNVWRIAARLEELCPLLRQKLA